MPGTKYHLAIEPADPDAEYMTVQETAWVLKCGVTKLRHGINYLGWPASRPSGRRIVTNRADRAHIYALLRNEPQPLRRTAKRSTRRTAKKTAPQLATASAATT